MVAHADEGKWVPRAGRMYAGSSMEVYGDDNGVPCMIACMVAYRYNKTGFNAGRGMRVRATGCSENYT